MLFTSTAQKVTAIKIVKFTTHIIWSIWSDNNCKRENFGFVLKWFIYIYLQIVEVFFLKFHGLSNTD